jgi:hypothetical protein
MADLDLGKLASDMLAAAAGAAKGRWPKIRDSVTPQFVRLAQIGVDIERDHLLGRLDDDEARTLVEMEKNTLVAIVAGAKGQAKAAAQAAINAALAVLSTAVNSAVKFPLL